MKYVLTAAQMQQCDANTMGKFKMPSAVLMERAALAAVGEIEERFPAPGARVLLACGTGNNGGDGLAMARLLFLKGYSVQILFPGNEEKCSAEAARQLSIVREYGIPVVKQYPEGTFDVIVDALFGIGLCREIGGVYRQMIERMNGADAWKLAVDIASGISADNGAVMGIAFRADRTATFGFAKIGQLLYPGAAYTGELRVEDIGIDRYSLCGFQPAVRMPEASDLSLLPPRQDDSNKGTYGKVLIFAGSYNMAGAAAFSAKAAYRAGAGLVKVATDASNRTIIQNLVPEAVLATWDERTDMDRFAEEQIAWADAVIIGPGIGRSRRAQELVKSVLERAKVPCLVDADGLNILAEKMDWIDTGRENLVLTPHLGEMARLCKMSVAKIKKDLLAVAEVFSSRYNVVVALKDSRTVTAAPCGRTYINTTGNHGMATGGSGDVLSGVIGALLARAVPAEDAAALGVMLHGMAGDAAAGTVGKTSMTASDIIDGLCAVLR
ncbi:MAG: NAD(P)H-hydrate dehydratase [Clostridiales bacterium]|nr:NAD(P)H-hydrate dehydratase [Clostridiales bacterium]